MDCGVTCLKMISKYYGRYYNTSRLKEIAGFNKDGVSMLGIMEAAQAIGFESFGAQLTYDDLIKEIHSPSILHWNQNHFVILIPSKRLNRKNKLKIVDPSRGLLIINKDELLKCWCSTDRTQNECLGTILVLRPTDNFYKMEGDKENGIGWRRILQYLKLTRWQIIQVFISLFITSILQFVFPFFTQSLVDNGIDTKNLNFIVLVLLGQLMLIFSRTIVDFLRNRLLLNISMIINISILSDFWIKLTNLPIAYFDIHHSGDTLQRINDNKQIQTFLSGSVLNTLFSFFNLFIFSVILVKYNRTLFLIFIVSTIVYMCWIYLFLSLRRKINYQSFHNYSRENSLTIQLIQGMQEIRLNNAEQAKRWEWENVQVDIFKLNFKTLTYNQFQQSGSLFINQAKDVIITFLVAKLVINGGLTFGAMLAIQYILGQLNSPIEQIISFVQSAQDAKISIERLNEVHQVPNEENHDKTCLTTLPSDKSIKINQLYFNYPGGADEFALKNINLEINEGEVTAIVGNSGSGKTTLLKILLKFYDSYDGSICLGGVDFKDINPSFWRSNCGSVLQNGYIFNDTILNNIIIGKGSVDFKMLIEVCQSVNILSFINSLPNKFETIIGSEGTGLSQGQTQRILIARSIYKDPSYLFFDEATNALDSNNERYISENLKEIYKGKTVVIVAHRLSTVKNANKIIVFHDGTVVESGNHKDLLALGGYYYELVKNQLNTKN